MIYTKEILRIAEFMGLKPIKGYNEATDNEYYYYYDSELKDYEALPMYNTWEEVMPVVTKIESLGHSIIIVRNSVEIRGSVFTENTKLEAVIKAITWRINRKL